MRILHIGKYYPPYHGGMETVLQNQVEGLLEAGADVRVLVAGQHNLDTREILCSELHKKEMGLIRAGNWGNWQSQPLTFNLYSLLRRQLAVFKPDIVQLHLPNPFAAAVWLLLAKTQSMPTLVLWHHADITRQRFGARILHPLLQACRQQARGIGVSSLALKNNSRELETAVEKVCVVPFGIKDPSPRGISGDPGRSFLFVGRLVPYKGLDVLLESIAQTPGSQLDIVGSGPLKNQLCQKIEQLNLGSVVRMRGSLLQSDLDQLLSQCRAVVLPSIDTSETFGLVQLEAMAAGKPIIASNLPTGVSEVNRSGKTGLLVTPGSATALAAALQQCLENDDLTKTWGTHARAVFLAEYTRDHMTTGLLEWYKDMSGTGRYV